MCLENQPIILRHNCISTNMTYEEMKNLDHVDETYIYVDL